ncbi:hypothetical protein F5Y16DRAFT_395747 [Xylariaceae sp. FL0255]|nr:hypothetical protein F5Y16DRAFT_395747 [Xylariaceae sp. FL0255]
MTSTTSQQPANPAPNNTAAPAATSYASAAGAAKKPLTPVVATGSNPPVVAAGSSAPAHHAKSSSTSPMNGRPNIMPAVPTGIPSAPAVAHGTSSALNGHADHNRKSSVTMSANGPNSYSANGAPAGAKSGNIQFGYQESPAAAHITPQPPSAPIPIPGARAVTEPRTSPSPIPQPSASGGRPPSSAAPSNATLNFGSFDSDRSHMRNPSTSQDPSNLGPQHSQHVRRGSNVSDMSNQAGPPSGMGRGGFNGGRGGHSGGRGGYNNAPYNQNMGYPPNYNHRNQQGGNRGNMAPNFGGGGRGGHHFTPPPQNRSPAMAPAMPQQPPNMPGANMANMGPMPPFYYPQPGHPNQVPNQTFLPSSQQSFEQRPFPKNKRKGNRRDSEKFSNQQRRTEPFRNDHESNQKPRRLSKRLDSRFGVGDEFRHGVYFPAMDRMDGPSAAGQPMLPLPHPLALNPHLRDEYGHIDLSPESGNFDRLLTTVKQNYYGQQYGPGSGQMAMGAYPMYPNMHIPQGQSPVPNFAQPHMPPYGAPGPQPMSRSSSAQISEMSAGPSQNQAPVAQGTPQQQPAQMKPAVAASPSSFSRPQRKSAAIIIKYENGETLDVKSIKQAPTASTAPIQQSRTPPVVSSTPTPPPKTSTPKSFVSTHGRTDSISNSKTAEEKRVEFMEKVKQQASSGEKPKEDDTTPSMTEKPVSTEETKSVQTAETEVKGATETKVEDEAPAATEPVATSTKEAEPQKASENEPNLDDDDEMERIIREMEEADAKREKEAEERNAKIAAEKAAKKKAEEDARLANAAENDRKLREQEREMERLEEEKERKREAAAKAGTVASTSPSVSDLLQKSKTELSASDAANEAAASLANLSINDKSAAAKATPGGRAPKPQALNLAPINTKSVEPPQPSAALQSLKTARLLDVIKNDIYPPGINSPNPALNAAVAKKGTSFKYDSAFLLQFKTVFTEQPSLDFHQQVKTLIGDGDGGRSASTRGSAGGPARQNTRNGGGSQPFPFGQFGANQLPAGTTSAQRFEMSNSGRSGSSRGNNPMGSFPNRPGSTFGGGNPMIRTASSQMGSMPHSPRQGSRRNASKQNTINAKVEAQAAKTMPLTQGMKIEALQTSTTGWKPTSIGKGPGNLGSQGNLMEPAMVQRKVKAALNKMTPENFEKISDQILEIAAQSKEETDGRTLRQVIQLTFEKATDEAHWASMYAKFCKKMLETMSPEVRDENIKDKNGQVVSGGALFRKYLLNRCQEEFERGWKIEMPEPKEGEDKKAQEAAMLSDEYYKAAAAKRRGLGLVQFIGELYKLGMLTERIMHECVRKLVDYQGIPDEAEVESLSKLLRTIGLNLDATEKGKQMMDAYFQRIQSMIDLPDLPSRLQFMLMDVVDLRKIRWVSKEANKGPKTLDEVRAEAEALAAQKAAEAARTNQRGAGGRAQLGRGDARNFAQVPQPTPNQVGIDDLRRLKGGASRTSSQNLTLGPMSMLNSRSNSGRRLGGSALTRGAEDSGASSRTGTPPVRDAPSSTNSFGLLANMDSEHPGSPPSAAASPAMAKATVDTSATAGKDSN